MQEIESARLVLKRVQEEDFEFLQSFLSVPEHTRFLPMRGPYPMEQVQKFYIDRTEHWKKYHFGTYILHWKSSNQKIGYCGLEHTRGTECIQVLYGVTQSQWQQGIATEAAWQSIQLGFQKLDLPIIYGVVVPQNVASVNIFKKLGMTPDNTVDFYGKDVDYYSISQEKYLENTEAE